MIYWVIGVAVWLLLAFLGWAIIYGGSKNERIMERRREDDKRE